MRFAPVLQGKSQSTVLWRFVFVRYGSPVRMGSEPFAEKHAISMSRKGFGPSHSSYGGFQPVQSRARKALRNDLRRKECQMHDHVRSPMF